MRIFEFKRGDILDPSNLTLSQRITKISNGLRPNLNNIGLGIFQTRNRGKPYSIETKETHRAILRQFFNYIVKLNPEANINYINPVPEVIF